MKNVFAIEIDPDVQGKAYQGRALVDRQIDPELYDRIQDYLQTHIDPEHPPDEMEIKRLPRKKRIIAVAVTVGIVVLAMISEIALDFNFAFTALLFVLAVVGAVLLIRFQNSYFEEDFAKTYLAKRQKEARALWNDVLAELDAGREIGWIDVLDVDPCKPGEPIADPFTVELAVWRAGDRLYFADIEGRRFAVEIAALRRLTFYKIPTEISTLYKDFPAMSPDFIRLSQAAEAAGQCVIPTDGYAVLEFTEGGEDFGIWLPDYDVPTLERVLGMSAKSEPERDL